MISLKVEGLTHRQISDRLGISTNCIGVLLQRARGKLDGTYHDGLRLDINRKRREYVLKNPEKEKESRKKSYRKNREKRIEDMREYNKQYYQKHRIEILHKKKICVLNRRKIMKRYPDCIRTDGLCGACSASSYGRDCHNNNINKLLYQRSLAGMTQQQVADAAGMNIRQIQKFESGERDLGNMTLRNALSLAKSLDCEVSDFV